MVRLGKVYGNLMVDLRPTSAKLKDRSRRIVQLAAGVSKARAERLLAAAGGEAKTAILMSALGGSAREARARLRAAGGRLRPALAGSVRTRRPQYL
jgi:N-acetylmuramic acid 6-phosphate etherase